MDSEELGIHPFCPPVISMRNVIFLSAFLFLDFVGNF